MNIIDSVLELARTIGRKDISFLKSRKEFCEAKDHLAHSVAQATTAVKEHVGGSAELSVWIKMPLLQFNDALQQVLAVLDLCACSNKTKVILFSKTCFNAFRAATTMIRDAIDLLCQLLPVADSNEFSRSASVFAQADDSSRSEDHLIADEIEAAIDTLCLRSVLDIVHKYQLATNEADALRQLHELQGEASVLLRKYYETKLPFDRALLSKLSRIFLEQESSLYQLSHSDSTVYESDSLPKTHPSVRAHPVTPDVINSSSVISTTDESVQDRSPRANAVDIIPTFHPAQPSQPPLAINSLDAATATRRLTTESDPETRYIIAQALHVRFLRDFCLSYLFSQAACDNFEASNKIAAREYGAISPLVAMLRNTGREAEVAACTLWKLSRDKHNSIAIADAGAIEPLVDLLTDGNDCAKAHAAAAIRNLSFNDDNRISIANAQGVEPLARLLISGNDKAKEKAAGSLMNLAFGNEDIQIEIANLGTIEPLVCLLTSGSAMAKEKASGVLWNLSFENIEIQQAIIQARAIKPLVNLLTHGSARAKRLATGALRNLSINDKDGQAIVNAGAIEPLVCLLVNGSDSAKEEAAGALFNLRTIHDYKTIIANAGAVEPLNAIARSGSSIACSLLNILLHSTDSDEGRPMKKQKLKEY